MKDKDNNNFQKKHQPSLTNPLMKSMNEFFNQKPVKRLIDSIDEFFEQPFPLPTIPIKMHETEKALIIQADLPGIKKQQITLDYSPQAIIISIKHEEEYEENNVSKDFYFNKQSINYSSRTIPLPYIVDERLIKASYKNGQLLIKVPREPRHKIEITD
ncbi:Hsp20/alpha crystallin family protein [Litchfieldia salsa]|uniref:Molecular chaperone IbpA, HSP20 family n=1 Tax=Litchfieldia salsa TaxID=930152 RepID=A0A1H0TJ97_9BACI|nr:Hsp20/alpha crystallin family protein [Litchfieldia salsa]SDP54054.1 Molecular chaperone IbpA, HSP20 family [Litchfieldia salsa]